MNSVELIRLQRMSSNASRRSPTWLEVAAADLAPPWRSGSRDEDAEVEGVRAPRGCRASRRGSRRARCPARASIAAVDLRAVHQEEGLRDRAQDVVVGGRGIDAEEGVERGSAGRRSGRIALALGRPRRPSGPRRAAFLALAALARAFPGRCRGPAAAGRRPSSGRFERLGERVEDLVGAEPARAVRGERRLAGRGGRRADLALIGLGVQDRPEEPADVVAPLLPLRRPAARGPRGPWRVRSGPRSSTGS